MAKKNNGVAEVEIFYCVFFPPLFVDGSTEKCPRIMHHVGRKVNTGRLLSNQNKRLVGEGMQNVADG
ncbi:hypothetical protein CEXT_710421 [Caerostris extrusa]|uniref:Uncharacterized protein n=1 Tax=Caerostris extrusa TaxID=172846 RepID=A0AAV4RZN4_CAEEX|nr:hypothetical protein CEXT_710421 [Caerostris extrusa]